MIHVRKLLVRSLFVALASAIVSGGGGEGGGTIPSAHADFGADPSVVTSTTCKRLPNELSPWVQAINADTDNAGGPINLLLNSIPASQLDQPMGIGTQLTPLMYAARMQASTETLIALIQKTPTVSKTDNFGRTALHHASVCGNALGSYFLIQNGLKVDQADSFGLTPFVLALQYGDENTVLVLMNQGAKPSKLLDGTEPTLAAARQRMSLLLDVLYQGGAKTDLKDAAGFTALDWAIANNDLASVLTLVKFKANVNALGPDQAPPITKAAVLNNAEMVRVLLAAGAAPDAKDSSGYVALDTASANDNLDMVKALLAAGANPNLHSDQPNIPSILRRAHHIEVVLALAKGGAKDLGTDDGFALRCFGSADKDAAARASKFEDPCFGQFEKQGLNYLSTLMNANGDFQALIDSGLVKLSIPFDAAESAPGKLRDNDYFEAALRREIPVTGLKSLLDQNVSLDAGRTFFKMYSVVRKDPTETFKALGILNKDVLNFRCGDGTEWDCSKFVYGNLEHAENLRVLDIAVTRGFSYGAWDKNRADVSKLMDLGAGLGAAESLLTSWIFDSQLYPYENFALTQPILAQGEGDCYEHRSLLARLMGALGGDFDPTFEGKDTLLAHAIVSRNGCLATFLLETQKSPEVIALTEKRIGDRLFNFLADIGGRGRIGYYYSSVLVKGRYGFDYQECSSSRALMKACEKRNELYFDWIESLSLQCGELVSDDVERLVKMYSHDRLMPAGPKFPLFRSKSIRDNAKEARLRVRALKRAASICKKQKH